MQALYVDLDGTLLGPRASLFTGADGAFSASATKVVEVCERAGVEIVLYSGRMQRSVYEAARLLGCRAYIFELGCGLVVDDELEWLTGGMEPTQTASIFDQLTQSGAPQMLLDHFAGRLEYHTPWATNREVSHLFRGEVDLAEAHALLEQAGIDHLRLVDNGVIPEHGGLIAGVTTVHAYHLIPASASKARAVARHMQNRGYTPEGCIAVGDSREDMGAAAAVGTFWMVANGPERDPSINHDLKNTPNARLCTEPFAAGVLEAVMTTLAQRGT